MARNRHYNLADAVIRQISLTGVKTATVLTKVAERAQRESAAGWISPFFRAIEKEGRKIIFAHAIEMVQGALARVGMGSGVRENTRKQYSAKYPWVQPSPIHFEGLAPAVLNVPEGEVREFIDTVVARYVTTLRKHWMTAAKYTWKHPELEPVSDPEFARLIQRTPFGRFLNPKLEEKDRALFASILEKEPATKSFFKVDFSQLEGIESLPGMHIASTITLLEEQTDGTCPRARAIYINGHVLKPKDGEAWKLAKYYVLQGASISTLAGMHPKVHFPMDSINAISKSVLPEDHPLRQLLEPHFYLQLPLNFAVLYIGRSVAHNDQKEIYTPFPIAKEGFFKLMQTFYEGVPGNSSYPPYRFELQPEKLHSPYGDFLQSYFDIVLDYVRKITWGMRGNDPYIRRWADTINAVLPGFPSGQQIFHEDTLARAVATFIWNVSVVHSADHYAYAKESINKLPLRLRRPPPGSASDGFDDGELLVHWEDIFRHRMAWEMYFKPSTVQHLSEVDYAFTQPNQRRMASEFHRALRQLDMSLGENRFCPLDQIASSIQY